MRTIKVGVSISLTGPYSVQGKESSEGILLWIKNVNEVGGIYVKEFGDKLNAELVLYDDEGQLAKCKSNTERLIAKDKVNILLGPYSSSLTLAAAQISDVYNQTLWNHGGSTDEIEQSGFNHLISAITTAGNYAHGIIELVRAADPRAGKIAIFSALNSGFSRNVARGAVLSAKSSGFDVKEFKFTSGEFKLSLFAEELAHYNPDLILGVGRAEDDLALAKALINNNIGAKAIGLVVASIKLFRDTFNENSEGFLSSSQWERGINITPDIGPTPREFHDRFMAEYDKAPDYVAAQGYNIGLIIEKCISDAGTIDDASIRSAAKDNPFNTFYGKFLTDSNGNQIAHRMVTVQWQEGKKVIVYPKELAETEFVYPAKLKYI